MLFELIKNKTIMTYGLLSGCSLQVWFIEAIITPLMPILPGICFSWKSHVKMIVFHGLWDKSYTVRNRTHLREVLNENSTLLRSNCSIISTRYHPQRSFFDDYFCKLSVFFHYNFTFSLNSGKIFNSKYTRDVPKALSSGNYLNN